MILELVNRKNSSRNYTLNDVNISKVNECKHLGIMIDHRLSFTFTQHFTALVSRAHARASLIHKCFLSRDCAKLVCAFIIYVRPILVNGLLWPHGPSPTPVSSSGAVVPGAPSWLQPQARLYPPPSWGPRPRPQKSGLDESGASPIITHCLILLILCVRSLIPVQLKMVCARGATNNPLMPNIPIWEHLILIEFLK